MCGLFVVDDEEKFNENKAAEKNGEINEYYFRAIDIKRGRDENQVLKDKIAKDTIDKFSKNVEFDKNLLNFSYSNNNGIDIYAVSDFMLTRAFPVELVGDEFPNKRDLELQEKFVSVMANTFKNQNYQNKYDEFESTALTKENEISPEK